LGPQLRHMGPPNATLEAPVETLGVSRCST